MSEITTATVIGLLTYQVYVTVRVVRIESYTPIQKWRQVLLIWLLPFLGAGIVHMFLVSDKEIPVRPDKDFTPQSPNDRG